MSTQRGVVAAGSEVTAEAAARVLDQGGNAADGAVAACFAASAGEPTLTSLAGGGILIYRQADSGEATVCDFFSDVPRQTPATGHGTDFFGVDLDFGPVTQRFYIGRGSAAVPGVIPGLCSVLDRWGRLPLKAVVEPACEMLRQGRPLGDYMGRAVRLLRPIITYADCGRAIFLRDGRLVDTGDHFALPQLADTLEAMAEEGWQSFDRRVLWPAMLEQFGPDAGGLLTRADLEQYQVHFRSPLSVRYRSGTVLTNPPPSAGGPMIGMMLRLLDGVDLPAWHRGSTARIRWLCHAMALADEARRSGEVAVSGSGLDRWRERFEALRGASLGEVPAPAAGPGSTTHISVIDRWGNAAAVTFSYGEGNGHIIGDTGIMMNNLMGEEDLFPEGFGQATPGARLPSMMSPTVLLDEQGTVVALGTGGANRIRTTIVQVISALWDHRCDPAEAVEASRVHYEGGVLNAETFDLDDGGADLSRLNAPRLVRFDEPNLFFGGAHVVRRRADGHTDGAGDRRRGGVCRLV